ELVGANAAGLGGEDHHSQVSFLKREDVTVENESTEDRVDDCLLAEFVARIRAALPERGEARRKGYQVGNESGDELVARIVHGRCAQVGENCCFEAYGLLVATDDTV